jgi:hypothetical protein
MKRETRTEIWRFLTVTFLAVIAASSLYQAIVLRKLIGPLIMIYDSAGFTLQ